MVTCILEVRIYHGEEGRKTRKNNLHNNTYKRRSFYITTSLGDTVSYTRINLYISNVYINQFDSSMTSFHSQIKLY